MVLLGLLLVLLAMGAVIAVSVTDTVGTLPIEVMDRTYNLTALELFIAGVVTAAVFAVGLLMIAYGVGRASAKRRRLREERLAERDRVSRLEAEKRDLERRLETSKPPAAHDRDRDGVDDRADDRFDVRADDRADDPAEAPPATARYPKVDRDRDGVDDRTENHVMDRDRDRDRDRAERPTAPHHRPTVPAQQSSPDQLVAGGRRSRDDRRA